MSDLSRSAPDPEAPHQPLADFDGYAAQQPSSLSRPSSPSRPSSDSAAFHLLRAVDQAEVTSTKAQRDLDGEGGTRRATKDCGRRMAIVARRESKLSWTGGKGTMREGWRGMLSGGEETLERCLSADER